MRAICANSTAFNNNNLLLWVLCCPNDGRFEFHPERMSFVCFVRHKNPTRTIIHEMSTLNQEKLAKLYSTTFDTDKSFRSLKGHFVSLFVDYFD